MNMTMTMTMTMTGTLTSSLHPNPRQLPCVLAFQAVAKSTEQSAKKTDSSLLPGCISRSLEQQAVESRKVIDT